MLTSLKPEAATSVFPRLIDRNDIFGVTPSQACLTRAKNFDKAQKILAPLKGRNMSQRTVTVGGQEAREGKAIAGHLVANSRPRVEGGCRKIVHIGMQQNQIICGVLTGYCCCIRLPVWIPHLNFFCASTHDVIVRHHTIWCNEETSSG